jgi:hypothetical protein
MAKFKERMVVGAIVVALGMIGMFMSAHQVTATTPPPAGPSVTILGPLPLPVSINGDVSLTPGGSIQITNPASAPVLVRDVDAGSSEPFQATGVIGFSAGHAGTFFATVPAHKRLVIEHAALSVLANAPNGFNQVLIVITPTTFDPMSCTHIGEDPSLGFQTFACTTQTKLYAEAGQSVGVDVSLGDFTGSGNARVTMSGYYVPVP